MKLSVGPSGLVMSLVIKMVMGEVMHGNARQCAFRLLSGELYRMHSPERIKEVQESRRLGGLRRKRESTISNAYLFKSLNNINGIRRIVEIAILDTLAMENSIPRNRTLAALVQVALALAIGQAILQLCL